jgi:glycosyltransferase involved in cell wall biosynthesis
VESQNKTKIFISAYACEPNLGSEIGVGWHWVLEMSKYFDLWVLTRKSNQKNIESWIDEYPEYNHIHFLYFDLPYWLRFWKKGMRGVHIYYNIWQYYTNDIVKRTMLDNDIKIYHHLTYGNALWKVSSYGQKQFFIWGPVGGLETIPSEYSKHYGLKSQLLEIVRRTVVKCLPLNSGFEKRCRRADLILCKTEITRNAIPGKYRNKAILFTDVAVDNHIAVAANTEPIRNNRIEYLSVGRLEAWRGFDLLIESIAKAVGETTNIHLTIVGKGQDNKRLRNLIAQYHLTEHVLMTGTVSRNKYYKLLHQSDVVINASLKEGAVTVSFDSMSAGKPLICLDTTGYTRYFSSEYAVVIPIRSRNEVIENLKQAIIALTNDNVRENIGNRALNAGRQFTWESHGKQIYETILANYNK